MFSLGSIARLFSGNGDGRGRHRVDYDRRQLEELREGQTTEPQPPATKIPEPLTQTESSQLEKELISSIEGEVRFDDGSRALYSTDASNYRQIPIGVVIPKNKEAIIRTVALCKKYGAPIVSRGGGTSLAGQTCNAAVVIDMSKYYNQILWLDPDKRQARVQPGVVLDTLRGEAEKHHLTFGPDPSTHNRCTLGGMIGNDSCGAHALMAGKTVENIESLEILTYDGDIFEVGPVSEEELQSIIQENSTRGRIYSQLKDLRDRVGDLVRAQYPRIPRRVSGYNLDQLLPESGFNVARALVGTEGTCVVVLEATTRLVYSPPGRTLVVLGYDSIYDAADHVTEILKYKPIALEAVDNTLVEFMQEKHLHAQDAKLLPDGQGWLIVEFGGKNKVESDAQARAMIAAVSAKKGGPSHKLYDDAKTEQEVWKVRESGLGATARLPNRPDAWPGWEDSAVAPEKLGEYLRALKELFRKYNYDTSVYGHFGQGCVHCRLPFDLLTEAGTEKYRAFLNEAADLVVSLGGSLSGEHGDGQSRAELLPKMFSPDIIQAFTEFKKIWDPSWKMNPGKKVLPYKILDNLRLGINYEPWEPETHFQFPSDNNNMAHATTRCVGVGACRRHEGGTMCPSYMVTHEEMHSTRGRARLLFEMLQGNPLRDGWKDETIHEALDLCLACKGCKSDCPVNVDMATYKAEFLSHYYEGRLRPRNAYAFGLIHIWARLASLAPGLVNFFTQTPGLARIAKLAANVAPQRRVPRFAEYTFISWWKRRPPENIGKPLVLLWPDTFNNYFHPQTAQAAVEVLEDAGFQVFVPTKDMCCGRPLYDYGFVPLAKQWLTAILDNLRPYIRAGVPLIGLEPSCLAVFRDELMELMPNDDDAQRLHRQSYVLSEFLVKHAPDYKPPSVKGKAIVQEHCHHKSVMKTEAEQEILKKTGLDFEIPEAGCCGMAGAFGFEAGDHYDVSTKLADRNLVPSVNSAHKDTMIIADGFSCREQIEQRTDRRALHLAEVLKLGIDAREGRLNPSVEYPEHLVAPKTNGSNKWRNVAVGIAVIAVGAAAFKLMSARRHPVGKRSRA